MDFEELLEREKDAGLLDFASEDGRFLFWPFIRNFVLERAIEQMVGLDNPHAPHGRPGFGRLVKYLTQAAVHHPYAMPRCSALIFSSGVVNMWDGRQFQNRLYGHFCQLKPGAINLVEDSYRWEFRRPRAEMVYYHDLAQIEANVRGRVSDWAIRGRSLDISKFIQKVKGAFPFLTEGSTWLAAEERLNKLNRNFEHYRDVYCRIFERCEPEIIFLEDGSYGPRSYIFKFAKEMGIKTAEFQHGLVSLTHPAYNFPDCVTPGHPFATYLPELFLTFGHYWSQSVRIPGRKLAVGFPYLHEQAKLAPGEPPIDFLVISEGVMPVEFRELVKAICQAFPDRSVVFKLHPGEVPLQEVRYGELKTLANLTIGRTEPVYDLLRRTRKVIGCGSTVLYEALAFGLVPLVLDTQRSREHIHGEIFRRFTSLDDLKKLLEQPEAKLPPGALDEFWAEGGDRTFLALLEEVHSDKA